MAIVSYRRRANRLALRRRNAPKKLRGRRMNRPKVYHFKQTTYVPSGLQLVPGSAALTTYAFNAASLGNMPAFQTIYDQYSIRKVVMKFIPKFSMMASTTSSSVQFTSVLDFDDNNNLTAPSAAWQYQTVKMTRAHQVHTRVLRPCANSVFDAVGGGLSPKTSLWLDLSNLNVPHYGIKLGIEPLPTGAAPLDYDIQTTFYLAFKNVR